MSFRSEEKIQTDKNKLVKFMKWIFENDGQVLFPKRLVLSTYFDNSNFSMFHQSEEGTLPRKKIRLRSYTKDPHSNKNSELETKISSIEGRFKTTKKIFNTTAICKRGLIDSEYGLLMPTVRVSYERSYYSVHGVRLTIDRNLVFQSLRSRYINTPAINVDQAVVEIKAPFGVSSDLLHENFPFVRARFSKYSMAIKKSYNLT